jgi:preprotein translocase subunit SecE
VARPTRQRRRERREQRAEAGVEPRTRGRQVRTAPPQEQAAVRQPELQRRRGRFIAECWAELKKVEWPGQRQVLTGTVAVLIACAIVGSYLWVVDLGFKPLVERVFLGK